MKVTHYSNSFITIESAGVKIACDPWVGSANHGGWHSYPEFADDELADALRGIGFIYISHLHTDHFDPPTLKRFGCLDRTFLINEFEAKTLRRRLQGLGVQKIIELTPFKLTDIGGLRVATFPQLTSNSSGLQDDIGYTLDSSLLVSGSEGTFFNQVDNPLSTENFKTIKNWISDNVGPIDVATLVCGAASEYPQCFLNIDRQQAAASLTGGMLAKLGEALRILDPKLYFPSGGTYFIPGRFHMLNRFIAVPSFSDIKRELANRLPGLAVEDLEGGKVVAFDRSSAEPGFRIATKLDRRLESVEEAISKHTGDAYDHDADKSGTVDLSEDTIRRQFAQAEREHDGKLNELGIQLNAGIHFELHDTIRLSDKGDLCSTPVMQFALNSSVRHPDHHLKIHIEKAAFMRCVRRQAIWNQTLSGSLCVFERNPNIFYPTDVFSLNYLVLPSQN